MSDAARGFTERDFYLREFRGRTLLLLHPGGREQAERVRPTLDALTGAGARVVVAASDRAVFEALSVAPVLAPAHPRLEGDAWRALAAAPRVGVGLPVEGFAPAARTVAIRLGLFKLVWLHPGGGLLTKDGARQSFVDGEELDRYLAAPDVHLATRDRLSVFREVKAMLDAGIPAVNLCAPEGLDAELFTYAGVGTLFTREGYIHVRRLTIDDYDAAADLIARGVAEGYLAPRDQAATDQVLAGGFGAFVEGRHLAGIGSLLPLGPGAGEVSALYTLTRFLGEGIGPYLVEFACERGRALGYDAVFACTTIDRVSAFFSRNGFEPVPPEALPAEKWAGYDADRRARVQCHRRILT